MRSVLHRFVGVYKDSLSRNDYGASEGIVLMSES